MPLKAGSRKRDPIRAAFLGGSCLFFLAIVWVNFHSGPWYSFDMYADAYLARLMAEQRTLFPENWVFGNQYYVIATPVVAAFFYALCHNTVLAMSLASSLMTLLVLGSFVWCCRPFLSRRALAVGFFCLIGAVILADSAGTSPFGLQIFYTMASYYACYLWGILFHLGIYLRLREGRRVSSPLLLLALLTDLAFGMQSLRETLALNIPLLLLELWNLCTRGRERRSTVFVLLSLGFNLAGTRLIRLFAIHSSPIIEPVRLSFSPAVLSQRLSACLTGLFEISGLRYWYESGSRRVLFLPALFFWLVVIAALVLLLRRRDRSPGARLLLFSFVSLMCVCGVGVFLFRTRAIYYFVWFLLVSLCFSYLADALPDGRLSRLLLTGLLLCGALSFLFHFYPDYRKYPRYRDFYTRIADELCEAGVDTLYLDFLTQPSLAACSDDRLVAATFRYEFDDAEHPFPAYPHLKPVELFARPDPEHAVIVLSASAYGGVSSLDFIRENAPPAFREALERKLSCIRTETLDYTTLVFYRFTDPSIFSP